MASSTPKQKKDWLQDTWTLEIVSIILSTLALVVIVILLSTFNGQPQFEWRGITLNTIIAILATVTRVGFIVPVGESLAQWKWIWFSQKSRPLEDFSTIDDASRGSRGSAMLLWQTRSLSITSIGAWVIILSLATEPFIQQLVAYRDRIMFHDNSQVQIPYATKWDGATEVGSWDADYAVSNPTGNFTMLLIDSYGSVDNIQLDLSAQASVLFGLSADESHVAQQLPATCQSGNCTWPPYLSLAVCSACSDVSNLVSSAPKIDTPMAWFYPNEMGYQYEHEFFQPTNQTSYFLPNGLNIDNRAAGIFSSDYPVLMTTLSNFAPSKSMTFKNSTTLLFSTSVLSVDPSTFPVRGGWPEMVKIHATECGLYLCLKEYNSKFESGNLVEIFTEISSTRSDQSFQVDIYNEPHDGQRFYGVSPDVDALFSNATYFPRTDLQIVVPEDVTSSNGVKFVNISQRGIDGISYYLSTIFDDGAYDNATAYLQNNTKCYFNESPIPCGKLNNVTGMVLGNDSLDAANVAAMFTPPVTRVLWDSTDLAKTFSDLAQSISIEIRKNADGKPLVLGQLGTPQTVLTVRWPWIVLPIFCIALSLLFFLISVWYSQKCSVPLWRGGTLATLYHGLEDHVRKTVQHTNLPSEMEVEAEEVRVRLLKDDTDVFLLRHDPSELQSSGHIKEERTPFSPDFHT